MWPSLLADHFSKCNPNTLKIMPTNVAFDILGAEKQNWFKNI